MSALEARTSPGDVHQGQGHEWWLLFLRPKSCPPPPLPLPPAIPTDPELRLPHRRQRRSLKARRKSWWNVTYITGLSAEFAYPSHSAKLCANSGNGVPPSGLTRARAKKGSQHAVNAVRIIPSVIEAFLSLTATLRLLVRGPGLALCSASTTFFAALCICQYIESMTTKGM